MKNRRDQGKGAWTRVHGSWSRILIVLSVLSLSILGMVTSGFGFALIPIATGPSKEMAFSLAYDGTRILVPVMSEYLGPTPDPDTPAYNKLHAYRLDFSGVGGSALVTTASNGLLDAVAAYGGGKYLLVWLEGVLGNPMPQGTVQTIKGAFVNPDDTVGAPFTIASGACKWDSYENRCRLGLESVPFFVEN